tara:strand:+ start:665 stop:766 length:102 start_codon:yes stop_codon:yes gene_type:complete
MKIDRTTKIKLYMIGISILLGMIAGEIAAWYWL